MDSGRSRHGWTPSAARRWRFRLGAGAPLAMAGGTRRTFSRCPPPVPGRVTRVGRSVAALRVAGTDPAVAMRLPVLKLRARGRRRWGLGRAAGGSRGTGPAQGRRRAQPGSRDTAEPGQVSDDQQPAAPQSPDQGEHERARASPPRAGMASWPMHEQITPNRI